MTWKQEAKTRIKNMFGIGKKEKASFYQWMHENWELEGGLIPQSTAAELMKLTRTRINQMIKEGKLREFRYNGQIYVSYVQAMRIARKREFERQDKELEEELQKAKKAHPDNIPEIEEYFRTARAGIWEARNLVKDEDENS